MKRVGKRPIIIGVVVVVSVAGGLGGWSWWRRRNSKEPTVPSTFVSAIETSKAAIKDGVNSSNVDEALFVATDNINNNRTAEARAAVAVIDDSLLTNTQLPTKYSIILDSYLRDNNKDGFTAAAEDYKAAVSARDNAELKQKTAYLTQQYIDAVFGAPADIPADEETP